ncbi:MAG: bifunctional folylpolyglutamate synthase/dihydrofolate synthase [Clostridia bacterium]|nr:bifunctional folylpolyglutamate synthase/dihydrofolate synthase [Clostridia bacterium]
MNYTEAVDYIHSLLKFGIRPGLSGMDALLRFLDNPHKGLSFVHVAGTNGKGSVSTAISNVLISAGSRTGLYTSPFVSEFLERVQFNGAPVDKNIFAECVSNVKNAVEELEKKDVIITEFEALTASAFLCFKELDCDIVVLEVGLGGRLDATNVIDTPMVNVITSLSLDHTGILGETVEEIAFEKCGTIKNKSNVICSYGQPAEASKVIRQRVENENGILIVPDEKNVEVIKSDIFGTDFVYKNNTYTIKLPGIHQVKNMTAVIEACSILQKKYNITDKDVRKGIFATVLPARVEIMNEKPLIILDGGHNEDGAKAFFEAVKDVLANKNKVFVVAGMMGDKAVENSLSALMKNSDCFVCVTPENPRAMSAESLFEISEKYCSNCVIKERPVDGVDFALKKLGKEDVLCVVGSLYLAGEVRAHLIEKIKELH